MVDGAGSPESTPAKEAEFQIALNVLFVVVYTIRFWDKKHPVPKGYTKFTLAPAESLWWVDGEETFDIHRPDKWRWTVMMRVPNFVTQEYFNEVIEDCVASKNNEHYRNIRLEGLEEGRCAQTMHVGHYTEELPTITTLKDYIEAQGYKPAGKHHEIYFNDPRRVAPDKLRTILRQPMVK